jgi:hypothetical protein
MHALTFSGVSGIGEVSASYLEPSSEIGSPSFIQLAGSSNNLSISLYTGFFFVVQYTSFYGGGPQYANVSSPDIQVPFGSTTNIYIQNQWGQTVGSVTNLTVTQSTVDLTVPLTITDVTPVFENMPSSKIAITTNDRTVTETGFTSFYMANGTSFTWNVRVFDAGVGHDVNLSGSNVTKLPQQSLYIIAPAALASLQVYVDSYSGAQIGALGNTPPDNVSLIVNGVPEQIASTVYGYVGEKMHIQVYDVLGNLLYNGSTFLNTTGNAFTAVISTPSYTLGLKNDEQAKPGTARSIETIRITDNATGRVYTYTNTIGQATSQYLAAGIYSVYAHDNLTAYLNFSLNSDISYTMFGQQFLTSNEFNNITSAIYNNTKHFTITPTSVSTTGIEGQTQNFTFNFYAAGGTLFTQTELENFVANSTVYVGNSTVKYPVSLGATGNTLYGTFTDPSAQGSFTFFIQGYLKIGGSIISGEYSLPLYVQQSLISSNGMHLYIDGSGAPYLNENYTYDLSMYYDNGSALTSTQTTQAIANLTVYVQGPHGIIVRPKPFVVASGIIGITFSVNSTGNNYSVFASTYLKDPTNVSASYLFPFTVIPNDNILEIRPVDMPQSATVNQRMIYEMNFAYPNGTALSHGNMESLENSITASIRNSQIINSTFYLNGTTLYVNFTAGDAGSYTFSLFGQWINAGVTYSISYSQPVTVTNTSLVATGISFVTSPSAGSSIEVNTTQVVYLYMYYASSNNATLLSASDTLAVANHTTLELYDGSTFMGVLPFTVSGDGTLKFDINMTSTGSNWHVQLIISSTTISTSAVVKANEPVPYVSSDVSPTNPLGLFGGLAGLGHVFTAIANFFVTFGDDLLVIVGIGGFIYGLYRYIRRRDEKRANDVNGDVDYSKQRILYKARFDGIQSLTTAEMQTYKGIDPKEIEDYDEQMNAMQTGGEDKVAFDEQHPDLAKL